MNLDRVAKNEVSALNAQHYFTGWDATLQRTTGGKGKVGVLTFDTPGFSHAVDKVLVPALGAIGYGPASGDVIKVSAPQRTSDTGAVAAAVSSAVLKFRNDGVEHVIIFEASAVLSLLFLNNAQAQRRECWRSETASASMAADAVALLARSTPPDSGNRRRITRVWWRERRCG